MFAATVAVILAQVPGPQVQDVGWLAGRWVSERGERWTEERWSEPRGGIMLGTTLNGRGSRATTYEFSRIQADASGAVSVWNMVAGQSAVPFRLVRATGSEAVFENPSHDFPQRIAYRLDGNVLIATISKMDGSNPVTWRYTRR